MFPRVTHPSATSPEGPVRLACVRPAASVHSEPGSNSQVESSEELSLTSNLRTSACILRYRSFSIHVLVFPKKQEPTNREALTRSSVAWSPTFPTSPDMLTISTPMRPNRPHIPSIHINFKERGHKITSTPELRASCRRVSKFRYERFISLPSASRLHRCVCFASVRRCLGLVAESRKRKNAQLRHFLVTLNVYRGFSQGMLLR